MRRSIDANRRFPLPYFLLAAALGHLGKLDEARSKIKAGLALDPTFNLRGLHAGTRSENSAYLAQRERVLDDMRKVSLPEGRARSRCSRPTLLSSSRRTAIDVSAGADEFG